MKENTLFSFIKPTFFFSYIEIINLLFVNPFFILRLVFEIFMFEDHFSCKFVTKLPLCFPVVVVDILDKYNGIDCARTK